MTTLPAPRAITAYELVDTRTRSVLRSYSPAAGAVARRRADRMDLQYGAVRYIVRPVFA